MEPITLAMIAVGAYFLLKGMGGSDFSTDVVMIYLQNAENELKKLEMAGIWSEDYFMQQYKLGVARFQELSKTLDASGKQALQQALQQKFPTIVVATALSARVAAAKQKWNIRSSMITPYVYDVTTGRTGFLNQAKGLASQSAVLTAEQLKRLGK